MKQRFESLSNEFNKKKNEIKKKYYEKLFNKNCSARKTWQHLNNILGKNKKPNSINEVTCDQGTKHKDPSVLPDIFNKYFSDRGEQLASKISSYPPRDLNMYNTLTPITDNFEFTPVSSETVGKIIRDLKDGKSPGDDGITVEMIKQHATTFEQILSMLFNHCIMKNEFPMCFKISKIVPIPKCASKTKIVQNFRPISLLSHLSKILERIMYQQLYEFYKVNDYLYEHQYGFREKSGTTIACQELVDSIRIAADERNTPAALFLDLSSAFDTVDHEILLTKLEYSGVRGNALELFKCYFKDRYQYCSIGSYKSTKRISRIGIPQGSCMSTLLYLIYVNDSGKLPIVGRIKGFADDTAILYEKFDKDDIENDAKIFSEYFRINKLTLNTNKSQLIIFNTNSRPDSQMIMFNGNAISPSNSVKYLGLHIDDSLKFKTHIEELKKSLCRITSIMYKVRSFLPRRIMWKIYTSLVHSKMMYLINIYGSANKTDLKKIFISQKRAIKIAHNVHCRFDSLELFTQHATKTLPLLLLYEKSISTLTHQIHHDHIHHTMSLNVLLHSNQTRAAIQRKLVVRQSRTAVYGDRLLVHQGTRLHNSLPEHIRNSDTVEKIKYEITKYLKQETHIQRAVQFFN